MVKLLVFYLVIINLMGLYVMYADKEKAKRGQYRIPEKTLWRIALVGGACGTTLGMRWFHHKNNKSPFKVGFPTAAIVEIVLMIFLFIKLSH
ncbi:DUF1294 domain-containing protein (plasmid) [Aneurinibacillus sp. Ricciae_BoGa-3]|uniref:DUF1294 domain-containing protein n=1 Tax=Aneurinibacillus sp. Ricciae_BoGa-3 TaxID=3022697 RepID=UPI00233F9D54|nr:DUF1294 domain-containing protein [Aneurinibacillus sp. Ricciae_BoGa-3]WCK57438.1 DUF1294 domain-containing protein [Aneurinibacillus sp. Ricciae_BoGa-3]